MRKVFPLFALTIPLLLLSSCFSGREEQKLLDLALTVQSEYQSMSSFSAQADLTADYGQRIYQYTLDVSGTQDETTLTVLQPDLLSGITARMKDGESFLEYEDLCLETGPLTEDGLSPMSAIPQLLEQLKHGYLMAWSADENDVLRITCGDPDKPADQGVVYDLWLDKESHALLRGEISADGRRCIQCTFSVFTKE